MQNRNVLCASAAAAKQMRELLDRLAGGNQSRIYVAGRRTDGSVCLRFMQKDAPSVAGEASCFGGRKH